MRSGVALRVIPLLLLPAACQSGLSTPGVPSVPSVAGAVLQRTPGTGAAHLYVATVTGSRRLTIERHRLHKGIPAKNPDLVYHGYSGLIAVSPNGWLFSTLAQNPISITAFPPGSHRPLRKIRVEPFCRFSSSGFNVINAIAADANGYLFVLIYSYPGALAWHERKVAAQPDTRTPCNGVAVYAPNAKGKARPVQAIKLSNTAGLDALAVDANDNLYVGGDSVVNEYANSITNPTLTRTFSGKYLGTVRALATDSAGDVFIANAQQSYSSAWIDRYSPSASGGGPPTSTIDLQGSGPHWLWSMAEQGRYLYIDDSGTSVDVYHAFKNGRQGPIDSLSVSEKVDTIAAGP